MKDGNACVHVCMCMCVCVCVWLRCSKKIRPWELKRTVEFCPKPQVWGLVPKSQKWSPEPRRKVIGPLCNHCLEKAMAPHSSTLAWKIPWMEEPGRLQSMRSLRVGHDWATSLSLFTFMHRRRKWQPTPVFLPGESQAWQSLVGCCLWGRTESDTTEVT